VREKVRRIVRRTDLRDDEVDGHFATEEKLESFGVGEEGASSEILELLEQRRHREGEVGVVE
jgi:hypothetical protein